MNLVTFSTDRRILRGDAPLQKRYATRLSSYVVYVGSKKMDQLGAKQLGDNAWAFGFSWRTFFSPAFWRHVYKADVISAQDPFETGLLALFCAALFRKPLYVQVHTDPFSDFFAQTHKFNRVRQKLAHLVLARATRIRTVSSRVKDDLVARGYRQPITVLPIYVALGKYRAIKRVTHKKQSPHMVMVGRLEKEKQFEEGIRALALVRAHGYNAQLTIVGEGERFDFLAAEAQRYQVAKSVYFAGWHDDITPFLTEASVLLVPSAYEGYGMVIVEALAAGVPVIAYDVGIAREAGASIAPQEAFADTVLSWAENGARHGELKNYPYETEDQYIEAWVSDIEKCI